MKEIEKIINRYQEIDWIKEQAALGTVVKVDGSSYRRIGARLFVSSNGQWIGGISGGCLEGDALKHAKKAILNDRSSVVVYDTTEDDPHQIGVGLGCNGRIEVLFTPVKQANQDNQIEFFKKIVDKRTPTILLQVLNIQNGDVALRGQFFTKDKFQLLSNKIAVSIEELHENIDQVYRKRKSKVFTLTNAEGAVYEVLFELIRPKIKVVCVGDNYDINALVNIVDELGWEIHIVGKSRKLSKNVFEKASKVYTHEEVDTLQFDDNSALLMMSHDYKTDLSVLRKFVQHPIPYIGILGPKKRTQKMQKALAEEGLDIDLESMPNLYAPIGLDIGAENPEEIALCIAAEIIAAFRERNGQFLKHRQGSIYDRTI